MIMQRKSLIQPSVRGLKQPHRSVDRRCSPFLVGSLSLLASLLGTLVTGIAPAVAQNEPQPTTTNPSPPPCVPLQSGRSPAGLPQLVSHVSQTATWMDKPAMGMEALVSSVAPQVLAYLNMVPFPQINSQARQARVPVMMYHDILAEKQVFFDVTPEEFEQDLKLIRDKGLTPISLDQLTTHLRTGLPLPAKPILLTFDDGYAGHYTYVYPLLKKYNYPAVFSIYTVKVGKKMGRSSLTWEQLRQMAQDPRITIASHSVSHKVMDQLSEVDLQTETLESKRILEAELGIPIRYFTYPEGVYNAQVARAVQSAGYVAALTMNDQEERLAGQSESLLAIGRIGQSRLEEMVDIAWGGTPLPSWNQAFDFNADVQRSDATIDHVPFTFITGGKPITIHSNSRYQVSEIIAKSGLPAIAGVDGTFFSLELLDSNEVLGPLLSRSHGQFHPGKRGEIPFLEKRPLVLISDRAVKFVPFDPQKHNTLESIQAELPDVQDAFVAAGWLVDNGQPQPLERFGILYSVNEERHRAFWGINQQGQPVVGVSLEPIGSVPLGEALAKAGFRTAIMLDSGASTSLAYRGELLVGYTPRPVPHVVALIPPQVTASSTCAVVSMR